MITAPKHGGPAFPCKKQHASDSPLAGPVYHPGMTFRDAAALAALPALIAKAHRLEDATPQQIEAMAKAAYYIADAMIAQRDKVAA